MDAGRDVTAAPAVHAIASEEVHILGAILGAVIAAKVADPAVIEDPAAHATV
jgi:hypothetical protein